MIQAGKNASFDHNDGGNGAQGSPRSKQGVADQEVDQEVDQEIEAKYLIDQADAEALVDALEANQIEVHPRPSVEIVDRYLDTADWRVLQAGWAYRWRAAAGKCTLGLKSVAMREQAVQCRTELEQPVDAFPDRGRCAETGKVTQTLETISQSKLRDLFQVRNHRRRFDVRSGDGALIEMAIDHVTVTAADAPRKRAPGRMEYEELELELKEGPEDTLRSVSKALEEQFGLVPSRLSKFDRGLQCAGLIPPQYIPLGSRKLQDLSDFARDLRARRLRKNEPVTTLVYGYLIDRFQEMLRHEPRAWEGLDIEGVHQMRVATRRVRAALRAFEGELPRKTVKALSKEFKWIAAVLGDVRDLDVYDFNFARYASEVSAEDLPSLAAYHRDVQNQRAVARKQLVACLASPRYRKLKEQFVDFLHRGIRRAGQPSARSKTIGKTARRMIRDQHEQLLQDGRAIKPDSPDQALHELRIDCKRMRYLLEFFQPIYGQSLNPFVKRLTKLQDLLGEFQDACVGTLRLRQYASRVPMQLQHREELIALGQLINTQRCLAAKKRHRFFKTWKRFDRKGGRKQILALLK